MWMFAISAAVLAFAAAAVAYPLVAQAVQPLEAQRVPASEFNQRTALLEAMSELETEYGTGKLSESDYRRHKVRYEREYLALVEEAETEARTAKAAPSSTDDLPTPAASPNTQNDAS